MGIKYFNGSYIGAEGSHSMDAEQVRNAIIVVNNEGLPFRGKPKDLADDVLYHILDKKTNNLGFLPIIYESNGGTDKYGDYTSSVIFQAVCPFTY